MSNIALNAAAFPEIFKRHGIVLDENELPIFIITIERTPNSDKITTVPELQIGQDDASHIISFFRVGETCKIVLTENGISSVKINGVEIDGSRRELRIPELIGTSNFICFVGGWLVQALRSLPSPQETMDENSLSLLVSNPFADLINSVFEEMAEAGVAKHG